MTLRFRLALALLVGCASLAITATSAVAVAVAVVDVDVDEAAQRVIEETNAFRAANALDTVAPNAKLRDASREFARYMAENGRYGHDADGRNPTQRAHAQGYDPCIVSENIAFLYRSAGYDAAALAHDMVDGWKNSPGHRKNMLEPAVTQIGVGIAKDREGRYFGVQLFGRPKSAAIRFTVENDAGRTIAYRVGKQRYSLGARVARTHTMCRRPTIAIDAEKPFSEPAHDGAQYRVIERSGSLAVTRR